MWNFRRRRNRLWLAINRELGPVKAGLMHSLARLALLTGRHISVCIHFELWLMLVLLVLLLLLLLLLLGSGLCRSRLITHILDTRMASL